MLENLDTKYLGTLRHAYGYATDVPQLLDDICSDSKEVREKAYYELYGCICHQGGTIYEATVYIFPFLIELFLDPVFSQEKKDDVAMLIADIAGSESHYYDSRIIGIEPKEPYSHRLAKEKEKEMTEHIQKEVNKIFTKLLPYLNHEEYPYRESIAMMLPYYPEYYDITLPLLEKAVSVETDEGARECMEEALSDMRKKRASHARK